MGGGGGGLLCMDLTSNFVRKCWSTSVKLLRVAHCGHKDDTNKRRSRLQGESKKTLRKTERSFKFTDLVQRLLLRMLALV